MHDLVVLFLAGTMVFGLIKGLIDDLSRLTKFPVNRLTEITALLELEKVLEAECMVQQITKWSYPKSERFVKSLAKQISPARVKQLS